MKSCLLETDGTGDDDIKRNETQKDNVAIFFSSVESEFKFAYTCSRNLTGKMPPSHGPIGRSVGLFLDQ